MTQATSGAIDLRLTEHLNSLVVAEKWDELFSQGGCFHFALRARAWGIGEFHCTRSAFMPESKADHVFVVAPDGRIFDRRGYRSWAELDAERKPLYGARPMTQHEVDSHISSMRVPAELHRRLFDGADMLIEKLNRP
jgi:hypothetical protein